MRWHGETYCLVGGYRAYGDAPIATPAKAKEEEPAPRQASKRRRAQEESHKDGGCPSPKIPRLRRGSKRRAQRSLLVGHLGGEDKPRAAETAQAPSALTTAPLGDDLFCLSLLHPGAIVTSPGQEQGASEAQLERSSCPDHPTLCSVLSSPFVGRRKNSLPCASRGGAQRRGRIRRDLTGASVPMGFGSESPPASTSTSRSGWASGNWTNEQYLSRETPA
uniref:uncharacterized protein LOC123458531 n=1 Tax=Jaculus jaculus TaxID=51337 RepID=UPI001E1B5D0F|nr:uncharacterized protein LOC123458531 [Jaculus jaculus]